MPKVLKLNSWIRRHRPKS